MWNAAKKLGFTLILGPAAAGALAFLDADAGVFDALRSWVCWLINTVADGAGLAIIWTFENMPGAGLLDVAMAADVHNRVLSVDHWIPVVPCFGIFLLWANAMLFWTAIRGVRQYILKT